MGVSKSDLVATAKIMLCGLHVADALQMFHALLVLGVQLSDACCFAKKFNGIHCF